MKIYIDINHPAHVHYFRNFIKIMESKGHVFIITNRNSKIINDLLDAYKINHIIRNKRPSNKNVWKTICYLLRIIAACFKSAFKHKPDIFMGFGSFPCTFTAFFFRKPCVLVDDTEHNKINHLLNKPFHPTILAPYYFNLDLGKHQLYFKSFVEYLYLHPVYFSPDKTILDKYNLNEKNYVIVRYITYDAAHDSNVKPVSERIKKEMIQELVKHYQVLLFHEDTIVDDFYKSYTLEIRPEELHHIMAYAAFCLTEGATMASESGLLGVPYLYINPLRVGNVEEQIKQDSRLATSCSDETIVMDVLKEKIVQLQESENRKACNVLTNNIINPTLFLVWFIENFPESKRIMKENPDYQYNFK